MNSHTVLTQLVALLQQKTTQLNTHNIRTVVVAQGWT